MSASEIVKKVWSYAHVLRDDGVGYGDYVEAASDVLPPAALEHPFIESPNTYIPIFWLDRQRITEYPDARIYV